jgi:RHS repeat-associated protein
MYKIWLEYCRDQQQGITTEMPTLTHPPGARLEQQNQALTYWHRAELRAKRTVEKEASNRPKPSDQMQEQQASNITESNSLPAVVIDDETRQKAARSISPLLDVPTAQPATSFNQVVFNQYRGIVGVSSYSGNSPYSSQLQPNSPEAIMVNNNQLLAEMNTETMKAKKLVNIETAKHLVDRHDSQKQQANLNPSTNSGSQMVRRFVYGTQGPISMSQLINGQWITSYFIYDGEGNVRTLTDPNGNVTDTFDYDSFGNLINRTGNTPNARLYHGQEYDPDLGIYYLRSRYLNASAGRFFTMDTDEGDTEDPLSLHKYVYAQNNPVNKFDPSGHFAVDVAIGENFFNTFASGATFGNINYSRNFVFQQSTPFPPLQGDHFALAHEAIFKAVVLTATKPSCDQALKEYGTPSLFVNAATILNKENKVFDGSTSTAFYNGDKAQIKNVLDIFRGNVNFAITPTLKRDLTEDFDPPIIFLGKYFFNDDDNKKTDLEFRTTIILHESIHFFGYRPHDKFGGRRALNKLILTPCFPGYNNPLL